MFAVDMGAEASNSFSALISVFLLWGSLYAPLLRELLCLVFHL